MEWEAPFLRPLFRRLPTAAVENVENGDGADFLRNFVNGERARPEDQVVADGVDGGGGGGGDPPTALGMAPPADLTMDELRQLLAHDEVSDWILALLQERAALEAALAADEATSSLGVGTSTGAVTATATATATAATVSDADDGSSNGSANPSMGDDVDHDDDADPYGSGGSSEGSVGTRRFRSRVDAPPATLVNSLSLANGTGGGGFWLFVFGDRVDLLILILVVWGV